MTIAGPVAPRAGEKTPLSSGEVRKRTEKLPPDLLHEVASMQYVLHPGELADLLSDTRPDQCRKWIDAWWAARDPIPTDHVNQARDEHERRVQEALARFRRGTWPGWDDRGEVLIRYGEPGARMQSDPDVVPPGEFIAAEEMWYYPQFNVYARFSDTGKYGFVQYQETVQLPASERPRNDRRTLASVHEPDFPMDFMDIDSPLPHTMGVVVPLADGDFDRFIDRVYGYYDLVDQMPSVYPFDFANMHIPAYVAVDTFRGGDGVDRVDVSTEFASVVRPLKVDSNAREFTTTAVFWDYGGREVGRYAREDTIRTKPFAGDSLATVLNQITITLPPATYRVAVTVEEKGSGRFAAVRREVECDDLDGGIAMSDLELARTIGSAREESAFNRGPLEVVPRPSCRYRAGQPVPLYFEVYHIGVDDRGARGYTVEYSVRSKPGPQSMWSKLTFRGNESRVQVRSSFESVASGPEDAVHMSAITKNLDPGDYVLEVAVTDHASSRRATRSTTFRLLK
ncbi:MAG TPA: GWxTD domain-containing protein [Candidatus Krumholzibacteria bacterium]|nr:GWxTD domain-containing protein [Candidatus Krumholzibacteria bacterium]